MQNHEQIIKLYTELAKERRKAHWDKVYTSKDYTQVLWHQSSPELSLGLIEALGITQENMIIDVGCGASLLADCLIEKAYKNLTLLDASTWQHSRPG